MPDYGHDIRFGTFITPSLAAAEDVVALAVRAEERGLDLVTFQDHPYQPRFLDAWTLLSFVAARTERIRLAGNVLNLPLRQPAVLARAAASLDVLSGGRVELALGAGAFWDAIAAMGGPRLSPGQAVAALEEAIDVVRGIWDVEGPTPFVVEGTHHALRGAKRGPAPAHEMEVWIGGAKPKMLSLVGRRADGWLPSLGRVGVRAIQDGNALIDGAARRHGRDPRKIRRLLNIGGQFSTSGGLFRGPADQWVDEIVTLAMRDGISTFILASDEPAVLDRFAGEVAPAAREAVAAERAG